MFTKLGIKLGDGVGSFLIFTTLNGEYVGGLTFHEQKDWQVTDSGNASKFSWNLYEDALRQARREYPNG
jgi:hypothetical protein